MCPAHSSLNDSTETSPGANVIKKLSAIYVLSQSVCQTRLEKLTNDKHSSSLRKSVIYRQKKFYNIGPNSRGEVIKLFSFSIDTIRQAVCHWEEISAQSNVWVKVGATIKGSAYDANRQDTECAKRSSLLQQSICERFVRLTDKPIASLADVEIFGNNLETGFKIL